MFESSTRKLINSSFCSQKKHKFSSYTKQRILGITFPEKKFSRQNEKPLGSHSQAGTTSASTGQKSTGIYGKGGGGGGIMGLTKIKQFLSKTNESENKNLL